MGKFVVLWFVISGLRCSKFKRFKVHEVLEA
jgi:hypothetical protein